MADILKPDDLKAMLDRAMDMLFAAAGGLEDAGMPKLASAVSCVRDAGFAGDFRLHRVSGSSPTARRGGNAHDLVEHFVPYLYLSIYWG